MNHAKSKTQLQMGLFCRTGVYIGVSEVNVDVAIKKGAPVAVKVIQVAL